MYVCLSFQGVHGLKSFLVSLYIQETVLVVSKDRGQFQETHFGNYSSGKRRIFKVSEKHAL